MFWKRHQKASTLGEDLGDLDRNRQTLAPIPCQLLGDLLHLCADGLQADLYPFPSQSQAGGDSERKIPLF